VKATVLGLGQIGAAVAQALVSAGHDVTVWNRTPGKTVENAGRKASVAPTAAEAIAASLALRFVVGRQPWAMLSLRRADTCRPEWPGPVV
jgi:3-hydroxyisobutyrate dehydrogenase-like beta-hydroxyacid dehydrogenase